VEAVLLSLTRVQRVRGERAGADSPLGDIAGESLSRRLWLRGGCANPCEGLIHFHAGGFADLAFGLFDDDATW